MPNLRATILLKCLFLMSGERSPFSSTKETDPLRFSRPLLLFPQTAHLCCRISSLLFFFSDEGVWWRRRWVFFQTRCSQSAYLISREENPALQLLLIRVMWSRPTNSYWPPRKPSPCLSFTPVGLFLCRLFLHLSLSALNLDFRLSLRTGGGGAGVATMAFIAAAHPHVSSG